MIYAGDTSVIDALDNKEEVLKNGYDDSNTDYTQIGTSAYNLTQVDNAYVGYMYGTPGSSTYKETHANINNSTVKEIVDEWYEKHIKGTEYENYLSDTLFCNDRSFASSNTGTGAGTSTTYYRTYDTDNHTLYCKNQNDRFTVNYEAKGNGDLTYPIGLVTADEAYLSGGYSATNSKYYLYTGNSYWTMTPYYVGSNGISFVWDISKDLVGNFQVSYTYNGVRPVINLRSDALKQGSGTADDPFMVY